MGGRARILLVDDRPENLLALEAVLSPLEHEMVAARSGEQALAQLQAGEFAVVLLDVMMPGMDGFETAAQIRGGTRNRDVPIILLTAANTRPDATFRGYTAGAVDYLAKPFDPWVLTAKVAYFANSYLQHSQVLDGLSTRLGEIAHSASLLAELPAVAANADAGKMASELTGQVNRLRDYLHGLR
jgi:CheY-like chemotaxis protein